MRHEPATIPLSAPIKAHGEDRTSLTLRPMTAGDLRRHGYPVIREAEGGQRMDSAVISRLVADLAGIPPSAVDQLNPSDWQDAMLAVLGFLAPPSPPTPLG